MNQPTNEILIDYIDGKLSPEYTSEIEKLIKQDSKINGDLEFLKMAIDTVRLNAIRERVSAVRKTQANCSKAVQDM